ncbi:UNVERIFIED_CONTAM: hypothetical protein FKN15_036767 [Acipenser sinensis]
MGKVGMLRHQVEEMQEVKQEVVSKYEEQLQRVKEELARLKRSYEKLQHRQLKEAREGVRSREEDQSEVSRLNRKLESLDWEQQRLQYQKQAAQLEAQRKTLAEQYQLIQVLREEKAELKSTLLTQDWVVRGSGAQQQQQQGLCSELARLREALQDKEQLISFLHPDFPPCLPTQMLREEKAELKSTLLTQDWVVRGSGAQQQQQQGLCSELARLREALQDKEQLIREGSLAELRQRYVSSFSELEEENQHLRRELAAARARLEMSAQDGQGRKGQQEEMQALRTRHHEEELSQQTAPPPAPRSLGSRSSSQDSLSSGCGSAAADSSDSTSVESLRLPLAPLPASPADTVATRFLQEEDQRSQELLQRLDAHVQDLRAESRETVQKYQVMSEQNPCPSSTYIRCRDEETLVLISLREEDMMRQLDTMHNTNIV